MVYHFPLRLINLKKYLILYYYNGSDISCFGYNDGEIAIIVSGGAGSPFNYSIDGGSTYITNGGGALLIGGLGSGTHDIVVQDINKAPPQLVI